MTTRTGDRFGHYKIISRIGKGGMGEVLLAKDLKLGRKVAIKFLSSEIRPNADLVGRFTLEAKAASALNHPNILTIYEIGQTGSEYYIATEFIEGKTLGERLENETFSIPKTLDVVIQIAGALSAAHKAGIIHRDIKPANVMIRQDGIVKILDFGLAKFISFPTGDVGELEKNVNTDVETMSGVFMGTPRYMSPEQASGQSVDHQTDIFSFGIVLYEMLAGRRPFEGNSIGEIIVSLSTKEPPPLSDSGRDIPKQLQLICQQSLQKRRSDRYQSFEDLLFELKKVRDEISRKLMIETTLLSETLDAEITEEGSGHGNKDALLLTEFTNLTGEEVFDSTLKMALRITLEQSPFMKIFPGARVRDTLKLMKRRPDEIITAELGREICRRLGLKAYIMGTVASLGKTYMLTLEAVAAQTGMTLARQLQEIESKEEVLKGLGKAAKGLREELGESLGSIEEFDAPLELTTSSLEALRLFSLGYEHGRKGENAEAISCFERSLEMDADFAFAYESLAAFHYNSNQSKIAADYSRKAYKLREKVTYLEKLRIIEIYYFLADGDIEKAIETAKMCKKMFPHNTLAVASLSGYLGKIGRFEEGAKEARRIIELLPNDFHGYWNLAGALFFLGEFPEVKEIIAKAVEKGFDHDAFHQELYSIAYWEKDTKTMEEQLSWFTGRTDEYVASELQTGTSAIQGQWRNTKRFFVRSTELAIQNQIVEDAARYTAEQALRIIFWRMGTGLPSAKDRELKMVVKSQVRKSFKLERNHFTLSRTALALALAGLSEEAENLVDEMGSDYPRNTLIQKLWLPTIRGTLSFQRGNPRAAIKEFEPARRFERVGDYCPQYLRGLAHLEIDEKEKASAEFQKILDNRGEAPLSALHPLAQLGKARATRDKNDYKTFFEMWRDADIDMPALIAAKREFEEIS